MARLSSGAMAIPMRSSSRSAVRLASWLMAAQHAASSSSTPTRPVACLARGAELLLASQPRESPPRLRKPKRKPKPNHNRNLGQSACPNRRPANSPSARHFRPRSPAESNFRLRKHACGVEQVHDLRGVESTARSLQRYSLWLGWGFSTPRRRPPQPPGSVSPASRRKPASSESPGSVMRRN